MNFMLSLNKELSSRKIPTNPCYFREQSMEMKKIVIATYTIPILYSFNLSRVQNTNHITLAHKALSYLDSMMCPR